jgi:hypothetical protein
MIKTRRALRLAFWMTCSALTTVGSARAEDWLATRVSGQVTLHQEDGSVSRLQTGMSVAPGSIVETSANGRAMMQRGGSSITIGPRSDVKATDGFFTTTVVQQKGTVELEVEKRWRPYFTVETPLLSAVVKGTHFTVTASAKTNAVAVARGLVQVQDLKTGKTADVGAGQRAATASSHGFSVTGTGTLPDIRQEAPRASIVEAAFATTVSASANAASAKSSATSTKSQDTHGKGNASEGRGNGRGDSGNAGGKGHGNGGGDSDGGKSDGGKGGGNSDGGSGGGHGSNGNGGNGGGGGHGGGGGGAGHGGDNGGKGGGDGGGHGDGGGGHGGDH